MKRRMDGIAAIDARVAEITQRIAQLTGGPAPSADRFAAALATAVDRQRTTGGASATAKAPAEASARMDDWLRQAIAVTGVSSSWAPALKVIAQHESGYNPSATNGNDPVGNGTYQRVVGLMQMLPSTFQANAAPGHLDIYNPVDNLISAIRYIQRRYGEPANTPGLRSMARGGPYRGY